MEFFISIVETIILVHVHTDPGPCSGVFYNKNVYRGGYEGERYCTDLHKTKVDCIGTCQILQKQYRSKIFMWIVNGLVFVGGVALLFAIIVWLVYGEKQQEGDPADQDVSGSRRRAAHGSQSDENRSICEDTSRRSRVTVEDSLARLSKLESDVQELLKLSKSCTSPPPNVFVSKLEELECDMLAYCAPTSAVPVSCKEIVQNVKERPWFKLQEEKPILQLSYSESQEEVAESSRQNLEGAGARPKTKHMKESHKERKKRETAVRKQRKEKEKEKLQNIDWDDFKSFYAKVIPSVKDAA